MSESNIKLEFEVKTEVQDCLDRLRELILSRILWEDHNVIYRRSVLTEVLIHLKQLTIKAKNLNNRITLTDQVVPDENLKINDVTDLIGNFRDAACHSDSYRIKVGNVISYFNESRGGVKGLEIE
jgi:hypothetical protein